jgi:integrase
MPHRSGSKRGTFVFDRRIPGVGRFRSHSGTTDELLFAEYNKLITDLLNLSPCRVDIIEAIRDKRVSPAAVLDAFRNQRLHTLELSASAAAIMADLVESWKLWVESTPNDKTAAARKGAFKAISAFLPKRNPALSDLPVALRAYRLSMVPRRQPAMFNRVRAAVSAYLRDHVGVEDSAYISTVKIATMKERRYKRPAPTPEQALVIRSMLEPEYAAIWWAMYCTGMGPEELWGAWTNERDHVYIGGTKREARKRQVPLLGAIARPTMHPRTFTDYFSAAVESKFDIEPYDARRGFRYLMSDSGVERVRIKQYMGHEVDRDVTDGYGKSQIAYHLKADAAAMQVRLDTALAKIASGVEIQMPAPKPSEEEVASGHAKRAKPRASKSSSTEMGRNKGSDQARSRNGRGPGRRRRAGSPLKREDGE